MGWLQRTEGSGFGAAFARFVPDLNGSLIAGLTLISASEFQKDGWTGAPWRHRCIQRDAFAHQCGRYFVRRFLGRAGLEARRASDQTGQSNSCSSNRSPAFSASPRCRCAGPDRWRDAAASAPSAGASVRIDVGLRIAEAAKQAVDTARHSRRHEGARAEQVVFAPSRHHVAEVDQPGQPPVVALAGSSENSPECIRRSGSPAVASSGISAAASPMNIVEPVEIFLRAARDARAGRGIARSAGEMNSAQRGSMADRFANRHPLHFRDGLADLAEHALLLVLRQGSATPASPTMPAAA